MPDARPIFISLFPPSPGTVFGLRSFWPDILKCDRKPACMSRVSAMRSCGLYVCVDLANSCGKMLRKKNAVTDAGTDVKGSVEGRRKLNIAES